MADLTAANQARLEKSLKQQYRFDGVVTTLQAYLEANATSYTTKEVPKYEYSRHKFNQMNNREQEAYEEKLKQRKISYRANFADGTLLEIPKIVFEHYIK